MKNVRTKYFKQLIPLYTGRKGAVSLVLLLGVGTALCEGVGVGLIIPLFQSLMGMSSGLSGHNEFTKLVASLFIDIDPQHRLYLILAFFLMVIILKNVMLWSNQVLISWLTNRVRFDCSRKILTQLLNVGYRYIQSKSQGTFYNWIGQESARTSGTFGGILQIATYSIILLIYVSILTAIAWKMAFLGIAISAVLGMSMNHVATKLKHIGKETSERGKGLASVWLEAIQSMRIIRIFGREDYESKRQRKAERCFYRNRIKAECYVALISPLSEIFTTIIVVTILMLFTAMMSYSAASVLPLLITFLFVMGRIQSCTGMLNQQRMIIASNISGVEEVMRILDRSDKPYIASGDLRISELGTSLIFKNVSYKYPVGDVDVIKNVSFDIPRGKVTAVVGMSGSGKSTMLDLVLRLDDPTDGEILVDGLDLREYRLDDWRRMIGMVDQETFIFNASVKDNIRYGMLEATDDDIRKAAIRANAHEFISELSDGYDTILGDRGTRLSGGQRQRIAIARAVLREAPIMIFDEATSSLDSNSEKLIHNAIEKLSVDRTVIIVAHRLSTVAHADNIVILKDGAVAEMGTHEELISKKGAYYQLYQVQSSGMIDNPMTAVREVT